MQSFLTPSQKKKDRAWSRKKARELRGLRRELVADWKATMLTLRLIIEELEGR
jgi:hypothetical protein